MSYSIELKECTGCDQECDLKRLFEWLSINRPEWGKLTTLLDDGGLRRGQLDEYAVCIHILPTYRDVTISQPGSPTADVLITTFSISCLGFDRREGKLNRVSTLYTRADGEVTIANLESRTQ